VTRAVLAWAVPALLLGAEGSAAAFERQHHLGVDGGLSMLDVADKSSLDVGAGIGVHYAYGLSDAFNLVVEGTSSLVALKEHLDDPTTPHTRPTTVSSLGVGVVYVFDVLRWVPYAGVLGSSYLLGGGTLDKATLILGAQLAVGLDYQITRSVAVGVAGRQHLLLTDLSTYPTYTTIFARVEYVWGW